VLLRSAYTYGDDMSAWDAFPEEWRLAGRENARAALADFRNSISSYPSARDLATIEVPFVQLIADTLTGTTRTRVRERREKTMSANSELLDRYVELYNAGDLDGVMDLYAEDAVQLMPEGTFEGRDAIRERLARDLVACPDIDWTVLSFVEQGDVFADEWSFVATHTGPFELPDGGELPPTGKRVELRGMELVELRDGKIVVDNLYYDNMAVLAQLGLVPEGATM
jgi:steroid delta-isomerase-like uncharacterized protein